eukprot:853665_1
MYCIQIHRIDASHKTWTIVTVRIVDERSLQNMIYNARAFACGYITKEMGSFAATFIGYCYPISKQSRVMMISCHTTKTKTIRTAHYVFCDKLLQEKFDIFDGKKMNKVQLQIPSVFMDD